MKTIEMARHELTQMNTNLNQLLLNEQLKECIDFYYFLLTNIDTISKNVENIQKVSADKLKEYNEQITLAQKEYAQKDSKGEMIVKNNQITFPEETLGSYNKRIQELQTEFSTVLEENTNFLKETEKIEFTTIAYKSLPKTLDGKGMSIIFKLIDKQDQ